MRSAEAGMIEVRYSKKQVWLYWLTLVPMIYFALWVGQFFKGPRIFSPMVLIGVAVIFAVAAILILVHDGLAFRAEHDGLTLAGIWRKQRIGWRDLANVDFVVIAPTYRGEPSMAAAIPYLRFHVRRGTGEKEIRFNLTLLDMPSDEGPALAEALLKRMRAASPMPSSRPATEWRGQHDPLEGAPRGSLESAAWESGAAKPIFGRKPG
jgi:hypothetical protein